MNVNNLTAADKRFIENVAKTISGLFVMTKWRL